MSKENLLKFASNNYYETNDEALEQVRILYEEAIGKQVTTDEIKKIREDLICDEKDNKETRLFDVLNTIIMQLHFLSQDIKETLTEGE